ncbi:Glycerol uptake facilitator protein [Cronobacter muytjensii 530]
MVGAALGAFGYRKLIGRHLPCDTREEDVDNASAASAQQKASL